MLKKHKKKIAIILVIGIVFLILVIGLFRAINHLTPDRKESTLGSRCELTENIEITDSRKTEIKEAIESHEGMKMSNRDKTPISVECNLIKMFVLVDAEITASQVREMAKEVLAVFSEEELRFYDLQLMVDSDNMENTVFPMIGMRHKTLHGEANKQFVW